MKRFALALSIFIAGIPAAGVPEFRDLFNGKDLSGWVNVNSGKIPGAWKTECSYAPGNLAREGIPIGVVDGIVSVDSYEAIVAGMANHAGTTPMAGGKTR